MASVGDLAKILYWGCVIWPLVGAIGILSCHGQKAKIRCHIIVTIILIVITLLSVMIPNDFNFSILWNYDSFTGFLRVMIALGIIISTFLIKLWMPNRFITSGNEMKTLMNLIFFHVFVCVAMLAVAINNFFILLIFLYLLIFLLLIVCFINGGSEKVKSAWNYFRYILFFMIIALMGVFILALPIVQSYELLPKFGSFILVFGIIQAYGLFPVCTLFYRLVIQLPSLIGSVVLFVVPIVFLSLFVKLFQISGYQNPQLFLIGLNLLSFIIVVLKEKDDLFVLAPFLLIILTGLSAIFANSIEGIYCVCLFVIMLVIFAPLGYLLDKGNLSSVFKNWFKLALSAFPPFGIFYACSVLIAYLVLQLPWLGYSLLTLFFIRGYFLFRNSNYQFFSNEILTKEGYCLIGLIILPSIVLPILSQYWIFQIALQFVHK